MNKLMLKKIISLILLLIWMGVIFSFSSANSNESTETSNKVMDVPINLIDKIKGTNTSQSERTKIYEKYHFIVRKAAHVTEYLILGVLMFNCLHVFNAPKKFYLALFLCFLYAGSDEFHQYFTGRSARIMDVMIDTFGSFLGILIYNFGIKKVILKFKKG